MLLKRFDKHLFLNYLNDATLKYNTFIDIIGRKLLPIDKELLNFHKKKP